MQVDTNFSVKWQSGRGEDIRVWMDSIKFLFIEKQCYVSDTTSGQLIEEGAELCRGYVIRLELDYLELADIFHRSQEAVPFVRGDGVEKIEVERGGKPLFEIVEVFRNGI